MRKRAYSEAYDTDEDDDVSVYDEDEEDVLGITKKK